MNIIEKERLMKKLKQSLSRRPYLIINMKTEGERMLQKERTK